MNDIHPRTGLRWPSFIVALLGAALITHCASQSSGDVDRPMISDPAFSDPRRDGGFSRGDGGVCGDACSGNDSGLSCDGGQSDRLEKLVIFGGARGGSSYLDGTWEWDGISWFQRNVAGPSPRKSSAATVGNKVVLFGGYGGRVLGETWEWDGRSWGKRMVATEPPKRYEGAMATLGVHAVLFGGQDDNVYLHDTWEWDGNTWTERNVPGAPLARSGHAMATLGNKVVLFGGHGEREFDDTWEWCGNTWTQLNVTGPKSRYGHAMATFGNKVILFGGYGVNAAGTTTYLDDTWEWDGNTWTQRSPAVAPEAREFHGMSTLGGKVLLFGGYQYPTYYNDIWEWDGNAWTKRNAATGPSVRHSSAVAILP